MISLDMEKEDFFIIYEPLECSYSSGNYDSQLQGCATSLMNFWILTGTNNSVGKGIQLQSSTLECIASSCWQKRDDVV